ncbi:hypothetical protein FB451DRAFT_1411530 [Mycena latifolia]|nr:hypothetical protein FB451DRAFT_1411530 [Mycena latifolia]
MRVAWRIKHCNLTHFALLQRGRNLNDGQYTSVVWPNLAALPRLTHLAIFGFPPGNQIFESLHALVVLYPATSISSAPLPPQVLARDPRIVMRGPLRAISIEGPLQIYRCYMMWKNSKHRTVVLLPVVLALATTVAGYVLSCRGYPAPSPGAHPDLCIFYALVFATSVTLTGLIVGPILSAAIIQQSLPALSISTGNTCVLIFQTLMTMVPALAVLQINFGHARQAEGCSCKSVFPVQSNAVLHGIKRLITRTAELRALSSLLRGLN